jgi:hypothetical protein
VLARFSSGAPALVERRAGEGRILLAASDLGGAWNDFPVHPAFVVFAREAVRYLGARQAGRREYLVAEAPAGVPRRPGIHQVDGAGRVAVNVDPAESLPGAMTAEEFARAFDRRAGDRGVPAEADARAREAEQALWRYGLALMFAVLLVEGAIGRHR